MGSSTIIDMIGSFLVAGMLLVMGLRLNAQANEATLVYNGNAILQSNITTLVEMLETDFRKIGYCANWRRVADPTRSILSAGANSIRFITDLPTEDLPFGDGTLDTIYYFVGPTSALSGTPNPNDRYLYRQVNSVSAYPMNLGVTQFAFTYFDANDDSLALPITDPRIIYYLQISITVQSAFPFEQQYMNDPSQYDVFWKQIRLVTRNLRNR